jgi:hypothetical protein
MSDPTAAVDLPTPAQMRAFNQATHAAWQARRMGEASRALVSGNIALGLCVLGTVLGVRHARWAGAAAPFVACGLLFGYLAGLFLSIRRMKRQRARAFVTVVDRREEDMRKAVARPRKMVAVIFALFVLQAVSAAGWSIALRHMSNSAILASLSIGPLMGMLFFVRRFVIFRFWEDLLFAGCVVLAYAPIFLRLSDLSPLSFLSLLLVILGTVSLHARWLTWSSSQAVMGSEELTEEVQS